MIMKKLFTLALMLLPLVASADVEIGGIWYSFSESEATVMPHGIVANDSLHQYPTKYSGAVTIPESVTYEEKTYAVTAIADSAFYQSEGLTTVTIPTSIKSIGGGAFCACPSLKEIYSLTSAPFGVAGVFDSFTAIVHIPFGSIGNYQACEGWKEFKNLEEVSGYGEGTFVFNKVIYKPTEGDKATVIAADKTATELVISDSVTFRGTKYAVSAIASEAFKDYTKLTSVTIPNGIVSIGASAFQGCTALTRIALPNSVETVGEYAFYSCTALTSVNMSEKMTVLSKYIFGRCSSMPSFAVPANITTIEEGAFYNCTSMPRLIIPAGVTSIAQKAFGGCSGLTMVTSYIVEPFDAVNAFSYSERDDMAEYFHFSCTNATLYVPFGSKAKYQDREGWRQFTSIEEISDYGEGTFIRNSVVFKLVSSGAQIIAADKNAKELVVDDFVIQNGNNYLVTSIADEAFKGYSNLVSIKLPKAITTIGMNAFENCTALNSIEIPEGVTTISHALFYGCTALTTCKLPSTLNEIDDAAFSGCTALTAIAIPNTVTSVGDYAFYNCASLNSVVIPTGLQALNKYVFARCSSLPSFKIPSDVMLIDEGAFYRCSNLARVIIPESVQTIGNKAFAECSSLANVYCYSQFLPEVGNDVFADSPTARATLSVPYDMVDIYSFESPWNLFGTVNSCPTITYMIDGEVYAVSTVTVYEQIVPDEEPWQVGYTFSGWENLPETMPNNDIVVTGSFTVNKYTITYVIEGQEYAKQEVDYGSLITPPAVDDVEGYTFEWSDYPMTMPAEDITITGSFIVVGINGVKADNPDATIYDLSGKRLKQPAKGINIIDGKKIVVK